MASIYIRILHLVVTRIEETKKLFVLEISRSFLFCATSSIAIIGRTMSGSSVNQNQK